MNEDQYNICVNIMEAILRRPIASLFRKSDILLSDRNIPVPLCFDTITDKLNKKMYAIVNDWIREMRTLFESVLAGTEKKNPIYIAALQLQTEFDEHLARMNPMDDLRIIRTRFTIQQIQEYSSKLPLIKDNAVTEKEPGAELFKRKETTRNNKRLSRDIRLFCSQEIVFRVSAFIYKIQPEVITIDENLTINFNLMSDHTYNQVRPYVTQILQDAAVGKIDIFTNDHQLTPRPLNISY